MNYDLPKYSLMEKDMPLDNFAVGGFNYGYPYENVNKIVLGTFLDPDFLVQEQGFLPRSVNAIGSAAFDFPKPKIEATWQNSGDGFGMPILFPKPLEKRAQAVPKAIRVTENDIRERKSNVEILADEQRLNNINFSSHGNLTPSAQWFKDPIEQHGVMQQLFGKSF